MEICRNFVGGILEGNVSPCIVQVAGWRCDDQSLHGWHTRERRGHINCMGVQAGRFWPDRRKKKGVHWKFISWPLCVQLSHFLPPCTLLIHIFRVIKGKEKKQIIFSYISVVVFFCYTIKYPYLSHYLCSSLHIYIFHIALILLEKLWIHTFPKSINSTWNTINLIQDLNSYHHVHVHFQ